MAAYKIVLLAIYGTKKHNKKLSVTTEVSAGAV